MLCIKTMAQQKQSRFFVELAGMRSFPVGAFASKDVADPYAGHAKTGAGVTVTGGYMFTRKLGALLLLGGTKNKQDNAGLDQQFKAGWPSTYTVYSSITTKTWYTGRVMLGGLFETPLSEAERFYFRTGILAGVCISSVPAYKESYVITSGSNIIGAGSGETAKVGLPWTFCYQVNAGLTYKLSNLLAIFAEASYFAAAPRRPNAFYAYSIAAQPAMYSGLSSVFVQQQQQPGKKISPGCGECSFGGAGEIIKR